MSQQSLPGAESATVTVDGAALLKHVEEHAAPVVLPINRGTDAGAFAVAVPKGMEVRSIKALLDEYRVRPVRRTGFATLTRLGDFIAHINRFKSTDTAVFVDADTPSAHAIYDYHPAGGDVFVAANIGHGARHAFPLSRAFKAWRQISGKTLSQPDFAAFLTEHAAEIVQPSDGPACARDLEALDLTVGSADVLRRLARGLRVNVAEEAEDVQNLENGDRVITFARKTTSTRDAKGEEVKVPGGFVVALPLLDGDNAATALPAMLRFDRRNNAVVWTITLLHAEQALADVVDAAVERIAKETGCPVFYGTPEGK